MRGGRTRGRAIRFDEYDMISSTYFRKRSVMDGKTTYLDDSEHDR